jgi:hypothetical protein
MKFKKIILGIFAVLCLAFSGALIAQDDTSFVPSDIIEVPAGDLPAVVDSPGDATDPVTATITQADVENLYIKYFANPFVYVMMIVFLTGIISKAANMNGDITQATSWILAGGLGVVGSWQGWGMFDGIDITHSIILGCVSAFGSNLLYSSGKINGILGAVGLKKKS